MIVARPGVAGVGLGVACFVLWLALPGCNSPAPDYAAEVVPVPNRDIVALSADDVVRLMRRAGFSDSQIVEMGTNLRNDLATTGAAKIHVGGKVEAIFAVDGHHVHLSSRTAGSAIYDVETARFR